MKEFVRSFLLTFVGLLLLLVLHHNSSTSTSVFAFDDKEQNNNIDGKVDISTSDKYGAYKTKAYNALANVVYKKMKITNLRQRSLEQEATTTSSNKLSWPECIDKDGIECKTLIEQEIINHHIEDLQVEIHRPRTPTQMAETYQKVEIVTNLFGKVIGNNNNGQITYPYKWEGTSAELGGTRMIGPWDCTNIDASTCCDKIRTNVSDVDVNGKYIDCFVIEQGLEPKQNIHGGIDYYSFIYDTYVYKYVFQKIAIETIKSAEETCAKQLHTDTTIIDTVLNSGQISVEDLKTLEETLMLHTRSIPDAQNLLSTLYLSRIDAIDNSKTFVDVSSPDTSPLAIALLDIKEKILHFLSNMISPRAKISVRVDETDQVTKTPTVGSVDYFIDNTDLLSGADNTTTTSNMTDEDDDPFGGMLGEDGGFPNGEMLPPDGVTFDDLPPPPKYCGTVTTQDGLICGYEHTCDVDKDCSIVNADTPYYCLSECGPM